MAGFLRLFLELFFLSRQELLVVRELLFLDRLPAEVTKPRFDASTTSNRHERVHPVSATGFRSVLFQATAVAMESTSAVGPFAVAKFVFVFWVPRGAVDAHFSSSATELTADTTLIVALVVSVALILVFLKAMAVTL